MSIPDLGEVYQPDEVALFNANVEKRLLGFFIKFPVEFGLQIMQLKPSDFGNEANKAIFSRMRTMLNEGKPLAFDTLFHELNRNKEFERMAGPAWYLSVWDCVPIFISYGFPSYAKDHVNHYMDIVSDYSKKRQTQKILFETQEEIARGEDIKDVAVDQILKMSEVLRDRHETLKSADEVLDSVTERLAQMDRGMTWELKTGFAALDQVIGGIPKQGLTVLGAKTKIGKTSFLCSLFDQMYPTNRILIFSIEMEMFQIISRIVSRHTGDSIMFDDRLEQFKIARNDMTSYQKRVFWRTLMEITKFPWWLDDGRPLFMDQIAQKARVMKHTGGLDCIMIDYLQRVKTREPGRKMRYEVLGDICKDLIDLSKELDVAILAPAQLDTSVNPYQRPAPDAVRESKDIANDCSLLLMLWKEPLETTAQPDGSKIVSKSQHKLTVSASRNSKMDIDFDIEFRPEFTGFFGMKQSEKQS